MIVAVPEDRRCIVVGAGLLGLCAAWALSGRRWRVTLVEAAGAVGHDRSGSKGDARIFRLGYPDASYVEMAVRSRELWRRLEASAGRTLLHVSGQVTFGDEAALDAVAAALAAAGAPGERLAPAEAARRFPGVRTRGDVLFEPGSGVLAADDCLRALGETADVSLHTGMPVTSLHQRPDSATVTTSDGQAFEADVVVDCAGPHALGLLGGDRPVAAAPSLPQVAYFGPAANRSRARLPVFIEWGEDMIYGLPVPEGGRRGGTYKVSHHTPGPALDRFDPNDANPFDDDPDLLALLTGAVRRLLPSLDPVPVATERCVYDNSPDADFVIGRVGNVVVGCGTSGHGFKFGPLLGELMADLAEGTRPPIDLGRFDVDRVPPGRTSADGHGREVDERDDR
jgi:sarcosine oxidase